MSGTFTERGKFCCFWWWCFFVSVFEKGQVSLGQVQFDTLIRRVSGGVRLALEEVQLRSSAERWWPEVEVWEPWARRQRWKCGPGEVDCYLGRADG